MTQMTQIDPNMPKSELLDPKSRKSAKTAKSAAIFGEDSVSYYIESQGAIDPNRTSAHIFKTKNNLMASNAQSGLLQMLGPTQNMSIYRKRNGEYGLRRKGGPTAKRFAKDPNYAQARINTSEFGQAAKGSALIRRAFRTMMPKVANDELHSRLTKVCKEVINSDSDHPRGSRMLMNGDLSLLNNFNFSTEGRFGLIVRLPLRHTVDRSAGTVRVSLPAFAPADMIRFPKHASHARLKLGVAMMNFDKETFTFESACSSPVQKCRKLIKLEDLTVQIPAGTSEPLFIAMAIEFMMLEKGTFIPVLNSQYNLMQLTGIDVASTALAEQSLPQEEVVIAEEAVVNTPIAMIPETRVINEYSVVQHDCDLAENQLVEDTQRRTSIREWEAPVQHLEHGPSRDGSGETKSVTVTVVRQPGKPPAGRTGISGTRHQLFTTGMRKKVE